MAGTFAVGDKVVFTGPVSENTPAKYATGVITRFVPAGVEVAMTEGRLVALPAASWTSQADFAASESSSKSMYLYALLAAVYGWWLWLKLKAKG